MDHHQDRGLTGANGHQDLVEVQDYRSSGSRKCRKWINSRRYNAGTRYNFSNSTVDADPGTGIFDFNNASVSLTTVIFICFRCRILL
jgi:hypothetical protein